MMTLQQIRTLPDGLGEFPAAMPPPGVVPNFDNPSNLNNYIMTTMVVCVTCCTLAVGMRVYTKLFLIRCMSYDDCELYGVPRHEI